MKERPILFTGAMVLAIRAWTNLQARRIVKPQPHPDFPISCINCDFYEPTVTVRGIEQPGAPVFGFADETAGWKFPYGQPGDRLWVRETFCDTSKESKRKPWTYRADESREDADAYPLKWKPSIFMPRSASRITLEIVKVRVERLQDISEEDAKAEGCTIETPSSLTWSAGFMNASARRNFCDLWERINGPGSWAKNPWVWVIEFKKV